MRARNVETPSANSCDATLLYIGVSRPDLPLLPVVSGISTGYLVRVAFITVRILPRELESSFARPSVPHCIGVFFSFLPRGRILLPCFGGFRDHRALLSVQILSSSFSASYRLRPRPGFLLLSRHDFSFSFPFFSVFSRWRTIFFFCLSVRLGCFLRA